MIFLRVLPKIFLWPHYSGSQELGGPGSLNRLNPRFLRHCWQLLLQDFYTPDALPDTQATASEHRRNGTASCGCVSVADFVQKKSMLGKQCVIVVRTTLGKIYQNKKMYQFCRPPCAMPGCRDVDHCSRHGDLHDSVVSSDRRGLMSREFIVFDGSQCYPELVVTFQVLPSCLH